MKQVGAMLVGTLLLIGLGSTAWATPTNKNTLTVELSCGTNTYEAVTIVHNRAPAVTLVAPAPSNTAVAKNIVAIDTSTGEVVASFVAPGFMKNGVPTLTCTATVPGSTIELVGEFLFPGN